MAVKISRKTGKEPAVFKGGPFDGAKFPISNQTFRFKSGIFVGHYRVVEAHPANYAKWVPFVDESFLDMGAGI